MSVLQPYLGEPLTRRETEVLRVLAETDTVREAAHVLGISRNTLFRCQTNALTKLGVTCRLAAWRSLGWLRTPDQPDA